MIFTISYVIVWFTFILLDLSRLINISWLAQMVKNPPVMQETQVHFLGQEDPLEKGMITHSSSCLENSMDRGAWRATVHGVAKGQTRLSD